MHDLTYKTLNAQYYMRLSLFPYPKPVPVMVRTVPPPVPPRTGLTPVMSAVFDASYVYPPVRVFVTPFSVTATSQAEVPTTGAVEDKRYNRS